MITEVDIKTITDNYAMIETDTLVVCASKERAIVVMLPSSPRNGQSVTIKNSTNKVVTIRPARASQKIDGRDDYFIGDKQATTAYWDGKSWLVV
jgi:hypothetical protein